MWTGNTSGGGGGGASMVNKYFASTRASKDNFDRCVCGKVRQFNQKKAAAKAKQTIHKYNPGGVRSSLYYITCVQMCVAHLFRSLIFCIQLLLFKLIIYLRTTTAEKSLLIILYIYFSFFWLNIVSDVTATATTATATVTFHSLQI